MTNIIEHKQDSAMIDIIAKAAADPNVDVAKLEKLLDMQERIMTKQAELNFNAAMAQLQPLLPTIKRTKKGHNYMYAPYEQIDMLIRPLYTQYGFSLSFNSQVVGESIHYFGTISHKEGHSRQAEIVLPADNSGSKNGVQAQGSTIQYAKRYLVGMLLNIVTEDEDNDAAYGNERLTENMVAEIEKKIKDTSSNKDRFLKLVMKVNSIEHILQSDYGKAIKALDEKEKRA